MSLLRTAARVSVASSVHGRVQSRQRQRWAEQAAPAQQAAPQAAPVVVSAPPAASMLDQLTQLGELRDAGVLTPEEFDAQKARILAQ